MIGSLKRLGLVWMLTSVACASSPSSPTERLAEARDAVADGDEGGWLEVTRLIMRHGPTVGSLSEARVAAQRSARQGVVEGALWAAWLAEAVGDDAEAWGRWRSLVASPRVAAEIRVAAATQLMTLVDRVALTADDLTQLQTAWSAPGAAPIVAARVAAVGEAVAIRRNAPAVVAAARRTMGAVRRFAVTDRLGHLPALSTSPPLAGEVSALANPVRDPTSEAEKTTALPGFGPVRATPDGRIASRQSGAGLYAVVVPLPAATQRRPLEVEIDSEDAWRAFVGGREVAHNPRLTDVAPQRTRFVIAPDAQRGVLELHLATRTPGVTARVFVRATGGSANGTSSSPPALDPLAVSSLGVTLALADADAIALDRIRATLEADTPWTAWLLARTVAGDATWPAERRDARAQQLYRDTIGAEPTFAAARAALVLAMAADGDSRMALAVADAGPLGTHADWIAARLGSSSGQSEPDSAGSEGPTGTLRGRLPTSCEAWRLWFDGNWEWLTLKVIPLGSAPGCAGVQRQVARLQQAWWRLDEALDTLALALNRTAPGPARSEVLRAMARVSASQGELRKAQNYTEAALAEGGDQEVSLSMRLSQARQTPAAAARAAAVEGVKAQLEALGSVSLSGRFQLLDPAVDLGLPLSDGAAIAAAAYAAGPGDASLGSYEVLLEDRHTRVYPDGAMAHRVHRVIRLLDARAVESFGEIALPEDAELLVARTWVADETGGVRPIAPEDFVEKTSVSLPELTTGAIAEVAWFWLEVPDVWRRPGFRVGPLALESDAGPTRLSRVAIRPPAGVRVETQAWAGAPSLALGDDGVYRSVMSERPRVQPEPLDPRPDRRLASVVLETPGGLQAAATRMRDRVVSGMVVSPAVEAAAREATAGVDPASPRDLLDAVQRWVATHIQEAGTSMVGASATHAAIARAGDRAMLTAAMARALGIAAEIVLVRPIAYGLIERWDADLDNYAYPVVRASLPATKPGGERVSLWLDTANKYAALDYLPPLVQGAGALALGDAAGEAATPAMAERDGERRVTLRLDVRDVEGNWVVEREDRLTGVFAASWRQALSEFTPSARERVLEQVLQQSLPGAAVTSVTVTGVDGDRATTRGEGTALVVRWTATGQLAANGGVLALTVGLDPESVGHRTVKLPTRTSPLLINRANRSRVSLALTVAEGLRIPHAPQAVEVYHPLLTVTRAASLSDNARTLAVTKTYGLSAGIVAPGDYQAWRDAAQRADRSEVLYIVVERNQPDPTLGDPARPSGSERHAAPDDQVASCVAVGQAGACE